MLAATPMGEEGAHVAGAQDPEVGQRQRPAEVALEKGDVAQAGGAVGLDGAGARAALIGEVLQERDQRLARTHGTMLTAAATAPPSARPRGRGSRSARGPCRARRR